MQLPLQKCLAHSSCNQLLKDIRAIRLQARARTYRSPHIRRQTLTRTQIPAVIPICLAAPVAGKLGMPGQMEGLPAQLNFFSTIRARNRHWAIACLRKLLTHLRVYLVPFQIASMNIARLGNCRQNRCLPRSARPPCSTGSHTLDENRARGYLVGTGEQFPDHDSLR